MVFSFYWTPTPFNWTLPVQETNLSRSSSTHLNSTQHLDLDLMRWALWREWLEQKASSNFQTTRRNALFTTERNVRLKSTWIKFRGSAVVFHGLWRLTQTNIRWKPTQTDYHLQDFTSCGLEKDSCVANQNLKDESCLIPCSGLYADIVDDSLKENMIKGQICYVFSPLIHTFQVSSHWLKSLALMFGWARGILGNVFLLPFNRCSPLQQTRM